MLRMVGDGAPSYLLLLSSPSLRHLGSRRDGSSWAIHLEPSFSLYGDQGRGQLELILWLFAFFWDKGHFVVKQAGLSLGTEDGL